MSWRDNVPSTTAHVVAFYRAYAYKHTPAVGPDPLAQVFFPGVLALPLRFSSLTLRILNLLLPGLYEYITARTLFFDDVFGQVVAARLPQVVFLGAGYDTRALRLLADVAQAHVFELDALATQRFKCQCLARSGLALPPNLHFVPINFDRDAVPDILRVVGFDDTHPTLFVWEGVTMYLTTAAIDTTLAFIRQCAPGSSVVFDYAYAAALTQGVGGARPIVRAVGLLREPYRFGLAPEDVAAFLAARGFAVRRHLSSQELATRYVPGMAGRVMTCYGNVWSFLSTDSTN